MADGTRGGSNDGSLPLIATDDAGAAGAVQIVKLAKSADGSAAPVTADDDGILVNLGANNDVTVSGTVTVDSHAVTNAGTFAVQDAAAETSLAVLDDWDESDRAKVNPIVGQAGVAAGSGVVGTTTQRVVLATDVALPAGTNAIGKLAANSGVDIGDVDVTSIAAGDNNIGNVDIVTVPAPLSTTGHGTAAAALRVELPTDGTGVIATVGTITNAVTVNSHAVTNAGTFATQVDGAALTALQLIDDPVAVLGTATYSEATTKGSIIGAVRRDADTTLVDTTNEIAPLQVDARGALKVEAFSGETLPVSLTSTTITSISAGNNNIGDVDVASVPTDPFGANADAASATGSISAKLRFIAATGIPVTSIAAGTNNIGDVDVLTLPNVTLAAGTNTNEVVGDIAHDTGVGGNPVQIAGAAQDMDDTAPPNTVSAESDTTRLAVDRDGALFVRPFGPRIWSYHVNGSSALTDTTVHSAPASGLSLYVTDIVVSSGAATAMNIFFEEGATTVLGPWYLEAINGRGFAIHFATPKKITAATALTVTTSANIAHSIDVTGFTAQG